MMTLIAEAGPCLRWRTALRRAALRLRNARAASENPQTGCIYLSSLNDLSDHLLRDIGLIREPAARTPIGFPHL